MGTGITTLGIAGVGLIGGSLGLAARADGLAQCVVGIGRSESRLKTARELGAIDSYTTDFLEGARLCDLLYLATPVGVIIEQIGLLHGITDAEILVTDAGSTKAEILRASHTLPPNIRFVAGHPMAGSEEAGVEAASPGLFRSAVYVLTPDAGTDPVALEAVSDLAEALGSIVVTVDAAGHDASVALTSHLPHIVAGIFVRLAARAGDSAFRLAAGSFRDVTRVASSPPVLWRDIAITNREPILKAAREFQAALSEIEDILSRGESDGLLQWFETSRASRAALPEPKEREQ